MKRVIAIVLAALFMASLMAACGDNTKTDDAKTETTAAAQNDANTVDLGAVLNDINTKFNISGLKVLSSTDDLNKYYQINADDVKQFAAELTTAAKQYTDIVIVEAKDQTAVANVKKALEDHLDTKLGEAKSYDAEQASMLEACSVKVSGNYVYLVVSDQAAEINSAIEAAIK